MSWLKAASRAVLKYAVLHPWKMGIILVVGSVLGTGGFYVYEVVRAVEQVAREDIDLEAAREALEPGPTTTVAIGLVERDLDVADYDLDPLDTIDWARTQAAARAESPNSFGEPISDEVFEAYLLLGADRSEHLADAIILVLDPADRSDPIMVSLPRDLWAWNLCRQTFTRLNEGLAGCAERATSSELMALMVEDFTGVPIDHVARVNFGGFAALVDAMGGVTICVSYPSRDRQSELSLPNGGCRQVNGRTALAWVRSRNLEQLRGGEWVNVGGSDFHRQSHQQDVLFSLAARAASFSSPATLADRLSAVSKAVRLDSGWTLREAVVTGWKHRGIDKDSVKRFELETQHHRSPRGQAVLRPAASFTDLLDEVHPLS